MTRGRARLHTTALVTAGVLFVCGAAAIAGGAVGLAGRTGPPTTALRQQQTAEPEPGAEAAGTAEGATPPAPAATPKPRPPAGKPPAAGLVAVVGVVDGDTVKVRVGGVTERVRVIGIDTPELRGGECYAQQAASRMQSLVQGKRVRLTRDPTQADRDRYGRLLRHVALPDGRQVALLLIAGGFGEEYTYDEPYAGRDAYRAAEKAARVAGKGIWSSGCRAPVVAAPSDPGTCLIKGNIASDGERIYHLPGQRYYDVTTINESKGERWFCTEQQARDAGWRPAQV